MSIEMESPVTVYEKLDAIGNLIEQMFMANMIGDKNMFSKAHKKAGGFCFDAMRQMESEAAGKSGQCEGVQGEQP